MKTKEEITQEIEELEERKTTLEDGDDTTSYDEALDEQGDIKIGTLSYSPSYVLKNVDETAYRCGLNDYNDSELTDIEEQISDLKEELKDLEDEEEEEKEATP